MHNGTSSANFLNGCFFVANLWSSRKHNLATIKREANNKKVTPKSHLFDSHTDAEHFNDVRG
jgi:hypothetical protein